MKEVRNKRLVLAGLVMLALLLAGTAAIAIFRETLTATITAQTGDLNVDFVGASAQDDEQIPIATCTANVVSANQLSVTIQNAYPLYECTVTATVKNTGTIDARFEGFGPAQGSSPLLSFQLQQPAIGTVIEDGQQVKVVFKVKVAEQGVQEEATYTATVEFRFRQALPEQLP